MKNKQPITIESLGNNIDMLAGTVESLTGTVDSLARIVGRGFESVNERFEAMHRRMDDLSQEMAGLRVDMTLRMDGVQTQLQNHPTHSDLEREFKKYRYAKEIDEVRGRVTVCEEKLGIMR